MLFPAFLGGGAEAVCAWILEALKEHELTLVTLSDVKLEQLDEQYGTSLAGSRIRVLTVPMPLPYRMRKRIIKSLSSFSLRQFYLSWYFRRYLANSFDLAISAFNEMDLGSKGIQYIHAPMFGANSEKIFPKVDRRYSKLRYLYKYALRWLSGYSEKRMRFNITITNSIWTAKWIKKIYNIDPEVIYPPTFLNKQSSKPWKDRSSNFVIVGRIARHRKLERAIRICSQLRKRGFDIGLHIVAGEGDLMYKKELKNITRQLKWVKWSSFLPREKYSKLLMNYKWGIHTMENEPWGIAVAEMVHAGVIPFVHGSSGTAEIVGNHELLTWTNEDEAICKMIKVLSDYEVQYELRSYLTNIARKFTVREFVSKIRQLIHTL